MAIKKLVQALLTSSILATVTSAAKFALPILPNPPNGFSHKFPQNESLAGNATFEQVMSNTTKTL